ncbi:MAG: PAS domain S-box protein [Bacteroidota bacterium]
MKDIEEENIMMPSREEISRAALSALGSSEARLSSFLEFIPALILIKDHELRPVFANQKAYRLFPFEDWIGKRPHELFPPEIADPMIQQDMEAFEKGYTAYEETWIDKEGQAHIFLTEKFRIDIQNEKPMLGAFITDITDKKTGERALLESEEIFSHFMKRSPVYVFFMDEQMRSLRLSNNFEKMLGKPLDELLGKTMFDLFPSDFAKKIVEDDIDVLRSGVELMVEEQFNGRTYTTIKFPIHIDGKPRFLAGFNIDITDQKHAERELLMRERQQALILNSLPVIFYRVAPSGNLPVTWISDQIKQITGYSAEEVLANPGFWELHLHPDDRDRVINGWQASLETGELILEYRLKAADGTYRWFHDHLVMIRDEAQKNIDTAGICIDITKNKLAEIALQESEKKYRLLAEYSADVIWILDKEGRFTFISPSVEKLRGYKPDEVLMQSLESVMTPASARIVRDAMQGAFLSAGNGIKYPDPIPFELEKLCKDGSTVWTESLAQPMYDDLGELTGFVGVSRNISERRLSQEALQTAEHRARALIENAPDGIVMIDKDGNFSYVSPPATRMFGFTGEELVHYSPAQLTHPDDLPVVFDTLERLMRDPTLVPTIMYRFRHKDGRWFWIESTFSNLLDKPGIGSIVINFRNVTDRKLAEDKLKESEFHARKLSRGIEQSPAAVIITDIDGQIEYVNPKFTAMTGYSSDRVRGKMARILKPGRTPEDIHQQIWQTIRSGKIWTGEYLSRRMNGEPYWESVSVTPILDPLSAISNYVITIEDISDRKKMINELMDARKKAEESDRLKSSFLANMSHEIRTPMNAIVGFSEMLSDPDITTGERSKFSAIIQSRSDDLMHIINDLLEISRIESGNVKVTQTRVMINETLAELEAIFRKRLQQSKKATLSLFVEKLLPDDQSYILTDGYILKQVFSNLIENSIKYTGSGSIKFGYLRPERGSITFFVSDTGIGISPGNQEIIFEHFRQADIENPHQYSGTGLGLAICKGSLALVQGKIWVESQPGKGSTFYFSLPFQQQPASPPPAARQPGTTPVIPQGSQYLWHGKQVLIVEDEPTNMEFLRLVLRKTQIAITPVPSGAILRSLYGNLQQFDLVLLDVRLPDANGWELAREIKSIRPELPIIAQTAFAMSSDMQKSLAAGCDNFISKPINKTSLLNMMEGYLGGAKTIQ